MGDNLPMPYNSKGDENGAADRSVAPSKNLYDFRKCPFCKEEIFSDAIKCKHCGSFLAPISDNLPSASVNSGFGNNFQIVTHTSTADAPRKSSDYIIEPPPNSNSMLGHGWSVLVISVIFSSLVSGSLGDEAIGIAVLGALIVAPWSIWLLSQHSANKALPAIALIIITLVFAGVTPS